MKVTARAVRSGRWWAVTVPEIDGLFTQARRLEQIPDVVADAAELLGHPDVLVRVEPVLELEERERVERVKELQRAALNARSVAADESRSLVADLRSRGLTVRDVAQVLGVSPQRVSQLASSD